MSTAPDIDISRLPLGPDDGTSAVRVGGMELQGWFRQVTRGLDMGRGDLSVLTHQFSAHEGLLLFTVRWIERARQAERAAVLAEIASGETERKLIELARSEGFDAGLAEGRAEATAETRKRDAADKVARERRKLAWSELQAVLNQ